MRLELFRRLFMHYLICAECAYTTDDMTKTICEHCHSELLGKCPICGQPISEARAIYCRHCNTKLRISICPIQ